MNPPSREKPSPAAMVEINATSCGKRATFQATRPSEALQKRRDVAMAPSQREFFAPSPPFAGGFCSATLPQPRASCHHRACLMTHL
jgi:hypothetical protein